MRVRIGGVPVVLGAIEIVPIARTLAPSDAESRAHAEVERIQVELARLDARDRTAGEQRHIVRSLSKEAVLSGADSNAAFDAATSIDYTG